LVARRDLKNIHRNEVPPIEVDEEANPEDVEEEEQDYTLSKEGKDIMFDCLNNMKVPSVYSTNIKGIINMKDKKFTNLMAHNCHMLMTQLLLVVEGFSTRESTISARKALCISQCNFTEGNRSKEPSQATE
jgi:hypothetical protein